jgi:hypothetical protein
MAGCVQNSAVEYNDILVSFKEKADDDFSSMNKFLTIAIQEKEYSMIDYLTATAVDSLNARIESLKQLELPPSTEKFREATIAYIQSLADVSKAYKSYSMLSDSLISLQQVDSVRTRIKTNEQATDSTLKVLISAQQEFAARKNIQL